MEASAKDFSYRRRQPEESILYKTLACHLNTFLKNLAEEGQWLPKHVEKELWAYLECGILAYGFVRVQCDDCKNEQLVAFSCKKRGFCPSCGAKRMAETAAHLVENIIPWVKVRQYVLSVPIPLRYWMASDKKLLAKVHKVFASEVERFYTERSTKNRSGSIAFVQRFGSALNLNVHFHLLQLEGLYEPRTTGRPKFRKGKPPTNKDIESLVSKISKRVVRLLRRTGHLGELGPDETPVDPLFEEDPTYASCMSASVKNRIALGERRGQRVRFIGSGFGYEGEQPALKGKLCAMVNGFSLHAAVRIPRHRRDQLERLIRYTARSSVCMDRMSITETGDIIYELGSVWKNGITHVLLSPLELIEKLAALVPLPNMHSSRYWGVIAPNSKMRKEVIPGKTRAEIKKEKEKSAEQEDLEKKPNKGSWSKLLSKVFGVDISKCRECGGEMRVTSSIVRVDVIQKILAHLGLSPQPPPVAPARFRQLFLV